MGRVSDRYGRKPMIILSLLGSSIGAIWQGLSKNITSLIISRALTGLFAGSWIVAQAYIADCTTPEERPKYLAQLEAFLAAAYILGPAIGGLLGEISYGVPFIAAGVVAAIALIFVIFFLHESLDVTKAKEEAKIKEIKEKKKHSLKEMFPLMIILCMIVEFCNRWQINGWDSYFNNYAAHRFGLKSVQFSFLVTGLGILSCLMNIYLLPFLIIRLNVPIPYISLSAGLVLFVANVVMGASNTLFGAIIGSIFLEIGYNLSTSAPSSIISTYTDKEIQGEVLSVNMMCGQVAMICAPLAMDWLSRSTSTLPFYVTGIIGLVVVICMFTISRMPGGLLAGRATREDLEKGGKPSDNAAEDTKEVEMTKTEVVVGDSSGVDAEKGMVSGVGVENGSNPVVDGSNPVSTVAEREVTVPSPSGENGPITP
ncbi:hypothetical protein WA588_000424, partial [Blastocystis sp. NMH]